jgi:LysM repeat protein
LEQSTSDRQLERRLHSLQHMLIIYRLSLGVAVMVIIVLAALLLFAKAPRFGRAIIIDGKVIAMVRNEKAAAAVRERLLASAAGATTSEATFREKWEDAPRSAEGADVLSISQAVALLRPRVTVLLEAFAIENSGRRLVVVPSKESAERVLDRLKARYAGSPDAVVRRTSLRPSPEIRPCMAVPTHIISDELEAVKRLSNSGGIPATYMVRGGDFPASIASRHHMTLDEFHSLNPDSRGRDLRVGQRLNVRGDSGLVVVTVKETVSTQTVAPPVVKERAPSLPRGERKIAQPGKAGAKRVRWEVIMNDDREVSRRAIAEEVMVAPVPQKVLVGTGPGGA